MRKFLLVIMIYLMVVPISATYAQSDSTVDSLDSATQSKSASDAANAASKATDQSKATNPVTPAPTKTYEIPFLPKPDGLPGATTGQLSDPRELRNYFLGTLFPKVTKFLISIVAVGSFAMLLFAGLRYLTALGDTEKGDSAKNTAIYAIVGLVVALLSFVAIQLISKLPLS